MDNLDEQLLDAIQTSLPLTAEPWRQLAGELGMEEQDVLRRVGALRQTGVIRRIGGLFDATRLGYRQTLFALKVRDDSLDSASAVVAAHPGVSHCYSRSDAYNLWATLAVTPDSSLGLSGTIQSLARQCSAQAWLNLPVVQRLKLDARFGHNRSAKCGVRSAKEFSAEIVPLTHEQKRAVRALQVDLPLTARPFDDIARGEHFSSGEELLVHAADFLSAGVLRRYAAVVHHVAAGATSNVLTVWQLKEDQLALAEAVAGHESVSHAYLRETTDDWPFNLYTMIHGSNREDCETTIRDIATLLRQPARRELWTIREYKKSPVPYFSPNEAEWETRVMPDGGLPITE